MSCLEQWLQCGQVSPFWMDIGWVHWAGHPEREKMYNIIYRRCELPPLSAVTVNGFVSHLCAEHLKEKT